jgi:hypothetical protein
MIIKTMHKLIFDDATRSNLLWSAGRAMVLFNAVYSNGYKSYHVVNLKSFKMTKYIEIARVNCFIVSFAKPPFFYYQFGAHRPRWRCTKIESSLV